MRLRRLLPVFGIVLFIYILTTLDVQSIIILFSEIPFWQILLSFTCIVPILLITLLEWQVLLRNHQISLKPWAAVKNIFIGYFYGFITPGGVGAYTRAIYVHEWTQVSVQQCTANIILLNAIDYVSLLFIGLIGTIILTIQLVEVFSFLFVILFLFGLCGLGFYLFFYKKNLVEGVIRRILLSKWFDTKKTGKEAEFSFYADFPRVKALILPFFLSLLGWIIKYSLFFSISLLFGFHIPFYYVMIFGALGDIIGSLPITIYGLGTREATLIGLFSLFNISENAVVSLSLFWFVIIWLFPSILGAGIVFFEDACRKKEHSNHS